VRRKRFGNRPGAVDTTGTTDRWSDRGGEENFANASPAATDFAAVLGPPLPFAGRSRR